MTLLIVLSIASFLISLFAVDFIRQHLGQSLLDIPNGRSSHTNPIPRGGGLGFIIAFAVTSAIALVVNSYFNQVFGNQVLKPNLVILWLVLTPLAIVGIIDDKSNVPAAIRYGVQLIAALVAVAGFGSFPQPWLTSLGTIGNIVAIALTVIGMTAIINFYNFLDGLDGLVAGVSAIQLGFLALYLHQPILWLLVVALLGFLWFNWCPATIFMGDAGSTILGATVASALLNTSSDRPIQAWSALAITLPLVGDAIYTLVRRLLRRENIFQAHRSHIYQRLQQSGWTHAQVAATYIGLTVLSAISISFSWVVGAVMSLVVVVAGVAGEIYLRSRLLKHQS